jgi:hypothetical protein
MASSSLGSEICSTAPTWFQKRFCIFSLFLRASASEREVNLGYLAQYGNSFFALWWSTHSWQLLWHGQSFFGQGQLGADITERITEQPI